MTKSQNTSNIQNYIIVMTDIPPTLKHIHPFKFISDKKVHS